MVFVAAERGKIEREGFLRVVLERGGFIVLIGCNLMQVWNSLLITLFKFHL